MSEENKNGFGETPEPTEKHVKNYLQLLGRSIQSFRKNQPLPSYRDLAGFAHYKISPYFGKNISRKTLSRVEKGDHVISFGLVAAVIQEMDLWPEVINIIDEQKNIDAQYVALVIQELKQKEVLKKEHESQQKAEREEQLKKMRQELFKEVNNRVR